MELRRDTIVTGGGLSGLSAALRAQSEDHGVLLIEKSRNPEEKCYFDEMAYHHALKLVLSDYANHDSLVYPLGRRAFWIFTSESHTAFESVSLSGSDEKAGYVLDRPNFDIMLRERFQKLGGEILDGVEVTGLMRDDSGCVAGVEVDEGDLVYESALTIIATGGESKLADSLLGLESFDKHSKVLVVKETLQSENDEASIRLSGHRDYASSVIILGDPLDIGFSWARLIAYANTLIIKLYIPIEYINAEQNEHVYIEKLKAHPSVEPIVRNLESVTFSKQTVRASGFIEYPEKLWNDGLMLTGKAAGLYHPFDCRMTDYSIVSGVIAGRAAVNASLDRRPSTPSDYPIMLNESFLIKDRNSMSNFMEFMKGNSKFSGVYPEVMFGLIDGIFTMDDRPKHRKKRDIEREIRSKCSIWDMLADLNKMLNLYG